MECANHWQLLRAGGAGDNREARADDSGIGALIEDHRAQGSSMISVDEFDGYEGSSSVKHGGSMLRCGTRKNPA